MNPDQLAELEEQRKFLLRSITDLDREHLYGDVDDHDYETLRDGYTARAASVLRAIEAGQAAAPPRRQRRPLVVAAWIVGTVLIASVAGWLVASASGQRLPGQSITGGLPGDEVALKLAQARQLLGVDPQQAIVRYQQVLDLQPDNVEAMTYKGWLIAQTASPLTPTGVDLLRQAIELDPDVRRPALLLGDHRRPVPAAARSRYGSKRGAGMPRQQPAVADGRHDPRVHRRARCSHDHRLSHGPRSAQACGSTVTTHEHAAATAAW